MISNSIVIKDLKGSNNITVEIGFSDDPTLIDSVRLKLGDKTAVIKISELYGPLFLGANGETRADMLPKRKEEMLKYSKQHRVLATKDIKKGERIIFNCEVDVSKIIGEAIMNEFAAKNKIQIHQEAVK